MMATSNLKEFSFEELKMATMNFSPDAWLAYGEWCDIYKGWVDKNTLSPSTKEDGMLVVIKKINSKMEDDFERWQSEINFSGRHYHPNLIGLLGYCWENDKLHLVYEFMQKGALDEHLFKRHSGGSAIEPLSWTLRLKIIIGAARGLTFLHAQEKKVIYRDFKTHNILLDENYNAKLSNFGLVKLGPSNEEAPIATLIAGSLGYIAPECFKSGNLYFKSDVYSFGVVLLELLMGVKVTNPKHPSGEQNLVDWLKSILSQDRKLKTIMDVQMAGRYSYEAALQAARLSLRCLDLDPQSRPSMKEVTEVLKEIEVLTSMEGVPEMEHVEALTSMTEVPEILEHIEAMEEKPKRS